MWGLRIEGQISPQQEGKIQTQLVVSQQTDTCIKITIVGTLGSIMRNYQRFLFSIPHKRYIRCGILFYPTYSLTVQPVTVSWILAEVTRSLGQRQRLYYLYHSKHHDLCQIIFTPKCHSSDTEGRGVCYRRSTAELCSPKCMC